MIDKRGLRETVKIVDVGCVGCCDLGVVVQVMPDNVLYRRVTLGDVQRIVDEHLRDGRVVTDLLHRESDDAEPYRSADDMPFFKRQQKVVLENSGLIDPQNIDEYIARDGYAALAKVLTEMTPPQVVEEITTAGLRGRGGGGFPDRAEVADAASSRPAPRNTSSATPTRATRAPSWTAASSRATRTASSRAWPSPATPSAPTRAIIYVRAEYPLAIQPAADWPSSRPRSTAARPATSSAPASTSTSRSAWAPAPSSAARRPP